VIQLSPPLVAGPEQFDEIVAAIRTALVESVRAL
jgi:adenosylmethionine-8-amino-7-oxononanoate aminotransferase